MAKTPQGNAKEENPKLPLYIGPVRSEWRDAAKQKYGELSRRLADIAERQAKGS